MVDASITSMSEKPFLSSTGKQRSGAACVGVGAVALAVGGLFLAIYFNKGIASSMNLGHLNHSLLGRIAIGLPLAGGTLIFSGGVVFICVSKRKVHESDAENRLLEAKVLVPGVLKTSGSSSETSSPAASPLPSIHSNTPPDTEGTNNREDSPPPPTPPHTPPPSEPSANPPTKTEESASEPPIAPPKNESKLAPPTLPVLLVNQANEQTEAIKLTPENYLKYKTELAKTPSEQNRNFIDNINAALNSRIDKAFTKALWVHERFKELEIKTAAIKDDHIVVDPRTLVMAREICQGLIEGLSIWLPEEEKSRFLQAILVGNREKTYLIKLDSSSPKIIEGVSIEKPGEFSLFGYFGNPFAKSLETAVSGFTEVLAGKRNHQYTIDKNALVSYFTSLSEEERQESLRRLRASELYNNILKVLNTNNTLEIPRKIFEKVAPKDVEDKRRIDLFVSEMGSASANDDIQEFVTFKYIELIFAVGNFNHEQFEKEIKKQLDHHANLSHESRSHLLISSKPSQFKFDEKFETINVITQTRLEDHLNTETFAFESKLIVKDPVKLGKCNLNLFNDHVIDSKTSNESILTTGEYLNPTMNNTVKEEIQERSSKLTNKLKTYNASLEDKDLIEKLKHSRLDVALLITYIRMHVDGTGVRFEKDDKALLACLAVINIAEAVLEGISKFRSKKIQKLIEKHQNYTQVLKAGLKVCLQQTQAEKANVQTVRKLKTKKYAICLQTLRDKLQQIIENDPYLKANYGNIQKLKDYADRNKNDRASQTYWGMVWDYARWAGEKANVVSPEKRDPCNEFFIALSVICDALLQDRSVDDKADKYEDDLHLNNVRHQYLKLFLPSLSHGIGLFEDDDQLNDRNSPLAKFKEFKVIFQELAYHMYSSINLDENLFELLDAFSEDKGSPKVSRPGEHPLIAGLRKCYEDFAGLDSTQAAPFLDRTWRSAKNNNHIFYANHEGNPTHVLCTITVTNKEKQEKQIVVKSYGSPTVENGKGSAKICNEFKAHLDVMTNKKQKHLHVSYQNFIPVPSFMGTGYYLSKSDEFDRSKAIVDLQDEERFFNTYYSIVCAKDSDFYHQKGGAPGLYSSYKDQLLFQFFGHYGREKDGCMLPDKDIRTQTGCYIPDKIAKLYKNEEGGIKKVFSGIADDIHQIIFDGKENLTVDEKKKFTELFYSAIVMRIAMDINVDSLSGVCKDMIDRGMMAVVRLYGLIAASKGTSYANKIFERRLKAYTMIRAYLVRKRAPLSERFDRMIEDYAFILANQEKVIRLFKKLYPNVEFNLS